MQGRLPDFLVLGVQKGGTTTLQYLLQQHPGAFLPSAKEIHYFSLHFSAGESWYRNYFSSAMLGQRCGEITPYYLFHPQAPQRVKTVLPKAKLIVLLRDPVERTLSGYFHSHRLGLEPLQLESALAAEAERLQGALEQIRLPHGRHRSHQVHSYLSRSRYQEQLPCWQHLFPQEQLLVLRSEDLFEQPQVVWNQVLHFLELDPIPLPNLVKPANAGRGEALQVASTVRLRLREQLRNTYRWVGDQYGLEWKQ